VKKASLFIISVLIVAAAFFYSCDKKVGLLPKAAASPPITGSACDSIKYSVDIQPILTANCNSCHPSLGPGLFSSYAGTKAKVDDGKFVLRILQIKDMPQGSSLSASDLSKIQCWIDAGAPNN